MLNYLEVGGPGLVWWLRGPQDPGSFYLPASLFLGSDPPSHWPDGFSHFIWVLWSRTNTGQETGQETGTSYLLRKFSGGFVKPILLISHWQKFSQLGSPSCKGRLGNVFILGNHGPRYQGFQGSRKWVRMIAWQLTAPATTVFFTFRLLSQSNHLAVLLWYFPFCLFSFYLNI